MKKQNASFVKVLTAFYAAPRNLSVFQRPAQRPWKSLLMEIAQVGTSGETEWQQNSLMDRLRANLLYFNIYLSDRVEVVRKTKLKDIQACEWRVTKRNSDEPVGAKCLSWCFVAFAKPLYVHMAVDVFIYTGR